MIESRRLKRLALPLFSILLGISFVADGWLGASNHQPPKFVPLGLVSIQLLFTWLFGPDVGAFVGFYLALMLGVLLVAIGVVLLRSRGAS